MIKRYINTYYYYYFNTELYLFENLLSSMVKRFISLRGIEDIFSSFNIIKALIIFKQTQMLSERTNINFLLWNNIYFLHVAHCGYTLPVSSPSNILSGRRYFDIFLLIIYDDIIVRMIYLSYFAVNRMDGWYLRLHWDGSHTCVWLKIRTS